MPLTRLRLSSLLGIFAHQIPEHIRERGEAYFLEDKVQLTGLADHAAEAEVEGTETYTVAFRKEKRGLLTCCSCPYFEREQSPCKHVWAALLALDEEGHLELFDDGSVMTLRPAEIEPGLGKQAAEYAVAEQPSSSNALPRSGLERAGASGVPWRDFVRAVAAPEPSPRERDLATRWARRELIYTINVAETLRQRGLAFEIEVCERRRNDEWTRARQQRISFDEVLALPDPLDRQILAALTGVEGNAYGWYARTQSRMVDARYSLVGPLVDILLPLLARTGRLYLELPEKPSPLHALELDEEGPWELRVALHPTADGSAYRVASALARGEERLPLSAIELVLAQGWFFTEDRVGRIAVRESFPWIAALRTGEGFEVPKEEARPWLASVLTQSFHPPFDLPPELEVEVVLGVALPRLVIRTLPRSASHSIAAELSFDYGEQIVTAGSARSEIFDPVRLRLVRRDLASEEAARGRLLILGFEPSTAGLTPLAELRLPGKELPRALRELLAAGWWVEAEGARVKSAGHSSLSVRSGIDWFDLGAEVTFDQETLALPAILEALRERQSFVRLGDGNLGLLPEAWLRQHGLLTALGKEVDGSLRFSRVQISLLETLLAEEREVMADATFERAKRELVHFGGVEAADPLAAFHGTLRSYQREGLGWLRFLARFGFGGCLADDMGLGKTIQVLALLAGEIGSGRPSLVVAPRSVVFNWLEEAARFVPELAVMAHTGTQRARNKERFAGVDLIVTTYGLLREDIRLFAEMEWNYLILDEAQAIKNASSQTAKAARLLKGGKRLALSGTPIENHLGELWSLFEFLNPGFLGRSGSFQQLSSKAGGADRAALAQALRPFILRRTKEQVLKELPSKTEQTLFCELEPAERQRYDELRLAYQLSLSREVENLGWAKAKIHVLEALLRLRQAACHPGLLDPKRVNDASAKFEALLPLLEEVLDGGHKVLVFSQFVSLLTLLRQRLDPAGVTYAYLDGRTRDRAAEVTRFQTDPTCNLFLISLKAGGLGLNLTAADYVFLLDPWWNPAVEAQAIDRAHRIGQTKTVFAYRIVARDTVEEKILALQAGKRELADSILNADNNLIKKLTREDLAMLLG